MGTGDVPTGTWVLVGSDPDLGVPEHARVDLTLAEEPDGSITAAGTAACNRYRGTVDLTDGRWRPQGAWALTRRACPPPLATAEQAVLAALDRATTWSRPASDELVLHGDDLVVRFAAD